MRRPLFSTDLLSHLTLLDSLPKPIDWTTLFGSDLPVEIEVGPGKGMFLANAAEANPGRNFLGIEHAGKYIRKTADRLRKRKLPNARVLAADASRILADYVPSSSVQTIHVYFPDPWWKARHAKRRIFTAPFLASISRVLVPDGLLRIATDVEGYFAEMTDLLSQTPSFVPLPPPSESDPAHDLDYLSNFERKFRIEGRPIYRAVYSHTEQAI
jgi:tRNA (guanine-N7-)-methyltransferase